MQRLLVKILKASCKKMGSESKSVPKNSVIPKDYIMTRTVIVH